jgi:hypothetical protein
MASDFLSVVPEAAGMITLPELAKRLRRVRSATPSASAAASSPQPQNTSSRKEELREKIVFAANNRIRLRLANQPYDQKAYQATARQVWLQVYGTVGVRPGVKLE